MRSAFCDNLSHPKYDRYFDIDKNKKIELSNFDRKIVVVNTPYFIKNRVFWINDGEPHGIQAYYSLKYQNITNGGRGFFCDLESYNKNSKVNMYRRFLFIDKNWVYFPMIDKYLKFTIDKAYNKKKNEYSLSYGFIEKTPETDKLKSIPFNLSSCNNFYCDELILSIALWNKEFGYNCEHKWKTANMYCYNELDTHDYDRFYFNGNEIKEYETNCSFANWMQETNKKYGCKDSNDIIIQNRNSFYEKYYNVQTIWKGHLDGYLKYYSNKEKNKSFFKSLKSIFVTDSAEEMWNNKLKEYFINSLKNSNNGKVLVMVPKDQIKLFIKVLKKIPDNELKDIKGYVWFLSDSRHYNNIDKPKYNIKYDTQPNEKYDAELSRISNGNLKAKYGRYLTKERYSEDYVAPSIYGNNCNDKPEW